MSSTTFSGPVTSTGGFVGDITGTVTGNTIGVVKLTSYSVATAPDATISVAMVIYTTDGVAGSPGLAFSNGTVWKRVDTPATTISAT